MATRHLNWPNCYNARDLGGLPTQTGAMTRFGAIVRSDIPTRLNEKSMKRLKAYGIRTIVDLREPIEVAEAPSIFTANSAPGHYFNCPLETRLPHVSAQIRGAKDRADVYCILLDNYAALFGRALHTIANAHPGVLVHCHAGIDRTGLVSALLLGLAGVSFKDIAMDYAASQERLEPLVAKIADAANREDDAEFWSRQTATPDAMTKTLMHLVERYGGVCQYVLVATGVVETEIRRICSMLLGSNAMPGVQPHRS